MYKYATCQLVRSIQSLPVFPSCQGFSSCQLNKDTSKVQQNRGENNILTHKPFTVDQKLNVSFSNTHFIHIIWCSSPAWGLLDTALTSNVGPRVETIGGNNLRVNI